MSGRGKRDQGALAAGEGGSGAVIAQLRKVLAVGPFYDSKLSGPTPDRFYCQVRDDRPVAVEEGRATLAGRFAAGREEIDCGDDPTSVFDLVAPPDALYRAVHEWRWLSALAALGEEGAGPARDLAAAWCDRFEEWSPATWTPALAGERLIRLCQHGELLLATRDVVWRSRILAATARQTRHLALSGHKAPIAYDRLTAAIALCLTGLCLPGCDEPLRRGLEFLRREARLQMRPDGGHVSRNPSRQLEIVLRLRMIEDAFRRRAVATPGFLKHLAARAVDHLDMFVLGDGRLALFNGGYEESEDAARAAVGGGEARAGPGGFAKYSGFQRLDAGRSAMVVDVGAPDLDEHGGGHRSSGYAGAGSFHFAVSKDRMIVNCGAGDHLPDPWPSALRQAAAHSTLSFDGEGADVAFDPPAHRRAENDHGQLLEIEKRFRARSGTASERGGAGGHMRRLFLRRGGGELIGEDALFGFERAHRANWRIRFHLHPSVRASLARDGRSALIVLASGEGWRFRTDFEGLRLEKSLYCGAGGTPQGAEQIVLAPGGLEPAGVGDMVVKWGWKRVSD
ncbi:MAG: heparinase II/III family protein [Pseudomonadota bacterium]